MEILSRLILLLFSCHMLYVHIEAACDVSNRLADKEFPNIRSYSFFSYELAVEYKLSKQKRFDFGKEYYDYGSRTGHVEFYAGGKQYIHHYSEDTNEGFHIQGWNCKTTVVTGTPEYQREAMTEWAYEKKPIVMGPSAMLLYALDAWKARSTTEFNMVYMGQSKEKIRGIDAQYWRRCSGDMQYDYFFTLETYDDAYGFDNLKIIPLRIVVTKDGSSELYPQTVDIITFQPYITDRTKLLVPTGRGCARGEDVDPPKMPDFMDKNLVLFGEVVYKDINERESYDYLSNFMFALNVNTEHLAYFFTPWGNQTDKTYDPDGLKHIIYDMKNKYLYTNDLFNDVCKITRSPIFEPNFFLPGKNGYISLTDPSILFPNNEFSYITDGMDRNMAVRSFEAIFDDYQLGSRTVPRVIITRNYLKDDVVEENTASVKNALTSIRMELFDKKDDDYKLQNELTLNFFGFSTKLEHEHIIFDVTSCFKDDTDFMWVTIGFGADAAFVQKINQSVPMMELELRNTIQTETELNPMRMPTILVDFSDMIYISFIVLDKPWVMLDYLEPEDQTTIVTDEAEGIKSLDGCGVGCLESEDNCWGFAICGATCYYGTGQKATAKKAGCKLYRRFSNTSFEPSKENIKYNLQRLVNAKQIRISVYPLDADKPMTLEARYIEFQSPGDDEKLFDLIGMETNPRLRVLQIGSKLDASAGTIVKNFGQLRYDECQRLCLDYQQCETVSYCLIDHSCLLSTAYGEDIPKGRIIEDTFCNLLTRKYADQFVRTPGTVLQRTAEKSLAIDNIDDCARACIKEKSFSCQSFDNCPSSGSSSCLLHSVHYLDIKADEQVVAKKTCGHYSRKYAYSFRKESFKTTLNSGAVASKGVTLEQCAKMCFEYGDSYCYGYDFCEDKTLTQSTCTLLVKDPSTLKTTYSPICNHFLKVELRTETTYTQGTAAWVGILCFLIAAAVGAAIMFGIGYWRANTSR